MTQRELVRKQTCPQEVEDLVCVSVVERPAGLEVLCKTDEPCDVHGIAHGDVVDIHVRASRQSLQILNQLVRHLEDRRKPIPVDTNALDLFWLTSWWDNV